VYSFTKYANAAFGTGNDLVWTTVTFVEEYNETISSECVVFVNAKETVNYLIGNKIIKLTSANKKYFILGYDGKQNRLQ
jgi:hypothetical protein